MGTSHYIIFVSLHFSIGFSSIGVTDPQTLKSKTKKTPNNLKALNALNRKHHQNI